ncbi:unnamed protein product [Fraxinus pennsylvanica]|uniref:Uncharacterized protein n=1 Tax=Fraxinus pennsylvanica TaxID=56036 RepID=A0AAD2DLR9_9LAMI|nr:unnamed protein product [Fraxinus pennsylvanica]
MEHQSQDGSKLPRSIIPCLQDGNPIHELCPRPDELLANRDMNFRSSQTTNAHVELLESLANPQSHRTQIMGTSYSSISPTDVVRSSELRSILNHTHGQGGLIAENIGLSRSQSEVPFLDISQDQYLVQACQMPLNNVVQRPVDQSTQSTYITNEIQSYNLPLSTLPPEFRLPLSSILEGQRFHPQVSMSFRNSSYIQLVDANKNQGHWSSVAHANEQSTPMRMLSIQGHSNLASGSSGFNVFDGSSSYSNYPLLSAQKRNTNRQDGKALHRRSRNLSRLRNDQGHRYSLYDPMHEAIGLAVDPHLRIFTLSSRNNENGTGKCLYINYSDITS